MILSAKEIIHNVKTGDIVISDFNESRLNPNSYNLRLHNELAVYPSGVTLDMKKKTPLETIVIPEHGYTLNPGELYLGRTAEWTETRSFVPMIIGRSSVGRLGVWVHVTAGFGDIGFKGYWTLGLVCVRPVTIYPDVPMVQIYYQTASDLDATYDANGKYQNSDGIQGSKLWQELSGMDEAE